MQNTRVPLGGVLWTIKFVNKKDLPKDTLGLCDWDKRLIKIYKRLERELLIDTAIHEMRHAQHKILFEAEDWIDSTSSELARGLIATGLVEGNAKSNT